VGDWEYLRLRTINGSAVSVDYRESLPALLLIIRFAQRWRFQLRVSPCFLRLAPPSTDSQYHTMVRYAKDRWSTGCFLRSWLTWSLAYTRGPRFRQRSRCVPFSRCHGRRWGNLGYEGACGCEPILGEPPDTAENPSSWGKVVVELQRHVGE